MSILTFENSDIYSCDLNVCPFLFPCHCLAVPWPSLGKKSFLPIRARLKMLCLRAAAGDLEEAANCVDRRQNGRLCPRRRGALCVGASVRFRVPCAPRSSARSIHRSDPRKRGSAFLIPVASCLQSTASVQRAAINFCCIHEHRLSCGFLHFIRCTNCVHSQNRDLRC